MADTNDVSWQLMKSPKELASWNFPMSEVRILQKIVNERILFRA